MPHESRPAVHVPVTHGDLPCPGCGYLRHGIGLERVCPECGARGLEGRIIASGLAMPIQQRPQPALFWIGVIAVVVGLLVAALAFVLPGKAGDGLQLVLPMLVPWITVSTVFTLIHGGAAWRTRTATTRLQQEHSPEQVVWEVWPGGVRIRRRGGERWIARDELTSVMVDTRFDLDLTTVSLIDRSSTEGLYERIHLRGPLGTRRSVAAAIRTLLETPVDRP